jgi:uncharacterized membrane protein
MSRHWRYGDTGTRLDRITAFTDGVFAVAITILVLDLRVPAIASEHIRDELPRALRGLLPNALSYTLSFATIALYWMGHHRCFTFITRYDRRLVRLNLIFLFFVSCIPFTTALNGAYGTYLPAFTAFAASVALTGFAFTLLWYHATANHRLVDADLDARFIRYITLRTLVMPLLAVIGVGIALVAPTYANAIWFVALPLFIILGRRYHREEAEQERAEFGNQE